MLGNVLCAGDKTFGFLHGTSVHEKYTIDGENPAVGKSCKGLLSKEWHGQSCLPCPL
jgi:hypothetical protein